MVIEAGLQDLEQALKDGALLMDVRESDEYAGGHVPAAPPGSAPASTPRPDRHCALLGSTSSRSTD
jgi:rhodanese-related sulfurtransferase